VTASAATIPAVEARTPYPQAARRLLRETLLAAARDEVQQRPWAEITMAEIAAAAGVSRQTLYKEFGSRDEFAQALVIHEGERFLDAVDAAVREHLDDPRAAVRAALETSCARPARIRWYASCSATTAPRACCPSSPPRAPRSSSGRPPA
jgi:AcrR family transcriptional regulator